LISKTIPNSKLLYLKKFRIHLSKNGDWNVLSIL